MATSPTQRERTVRTPSEFGDALKEVRFQRSQTQADVAEALGMNRSQLAHIEGGRAGRYLENALSILEHFGAVISISWTIEPADAKLVAESAVASRATNPQASPPNNPQKSQQKNQQRLVTREDLPQRIDKQTRSIVERQEQAMLSVLKLSKQELVANEKRLERLFGSTQYRE